MRTSGVILGIDCGGTRSVAIASTRERQMLGRIEAGPGNLKLLSDAQLRELFAGFKKHFPEPEVIGVGMAGCRTNADQARVRRTIEETWPAAKSVVTNDLETALAAADNPDDAGPIARVLMVSGTGSCCFGRGLEGQEAKIGGWGHLLGDQGSGYAIGIAALKSVVQELDRTGKWPLLGQKLLQSLLLNEPNELIPWMQNASKDEVANLSKEVFAAAQKGEGLSRKIVDAAAKALAEDAVHCARKIAPAKAPLLFVLAGGLFQKQERFANSVHRKILKMRRTSSSMVLPREPAWGAVELALRASRKGATAREQLPTTPEFPPVHDSPTERRNPRSMKLDELSPVKFVELVAAEDAKLPKVIEQNAEQLAALVTRVAKAFKKGGRLFYSGAGTSGRLGVLDASECPPTFRTDPEIVQGIIAGGQTALWRAVEGAEDDFHAGVRAAEFRGIGANDILIGIASSGRTPFVWGTIEAARKAKAYTVLLTCNPNLKRPTWANGKELRPHEILCLQSGPEILTGSTRLKAGTVTKLALNIISTGAMIQIGKVIGNLMVDLNPSNTKLRARAVRILCELAPLSTDEAEKRLEAAEWSVKEAYLGWKKKKGQRKS